MEEGVRRSDGNPPQGEGGTFEAGEGTPRNGPFSHLHPEPLPFVEDPQAGQENVPQTGEEVTGSS